MVAALASARQGSITSVGGNSGGAQSAETRAAVAKYAHQREAQGTRGESPAGTLPGEWNRFDGEARPVRRLRPGEWSRRFAGVRPHLRATTFAATPFYSPAPRAQPPPKQSGGITCRDSCPSSPRGLPGQRNRYSPRKRRPHGRREPTPGAGCETPLASRTLTSELSARLACWRGAGTREVGAVRTETRAESLRRPAQARTVPDRPPLCPRNAATNRKPRTSRPSLQPANATPRGPRGEPPPPSTP
jgi:hypothetical protein